MYGCDSSTLLRYCWMAGLWRLRLVGKRLLLSWCCVAADEYIAVFISLISRRRTKIVQVTQKVLIRQEISCRSEGERFRLYRLLLVLVLVLDFCLGYPRASVCSADIVVTSRISEALNMGCIRTVPRPSTSILGKMINVRAYTLTAPVVSMC